MDGGPGIHFVRGSSQLLQMETGAQNVDKPDFGARRRLDDRASCRSAFDTLLEETRQTLKMFDDDGQFLGYERKSVADALSGLLKGRGDASITIVLRDTGFVERDCPRLMMLLHAFAPRLSILGAEPSLRLYDRGLVIADRSAVIRRPSFEQRFAIIDYDEKAVAEADHLFEQILGQAGPPLPGHATGL